MYMYYVEVKPDQSSATVSVVLPSLYNQSVIFSIKPNKYRARETARPGCRKLLEPHWQQSFYKHVCLCVCVFWKNRAQRLRETYVWIENVKNGSRKFKGLVSIPFPQSLWPVNGKCEINFSITFQKRV